ncbi:MAG: response regulator [Deltaproteobacteria bacterium]|nr:MAG: response regulator [Deltaproteobacteria bacterium]
MPGTQPLSSQSSQSAPSAGRILLADDDDDVRRPIARLLEQAGYRVDQVATGEDASRALDAHEYDLLITDINMPGNRNLEILHGRTEAAASTPVIVITGYPTVPTAVQALRLAVVDYMIKPLDLDQLLERAHKAVEKGRALRAVRRAQADAAAWSEWLQSMQAALSTPGTVPLPTSTGPGVPKAPRDESDTDILRRLPEEEYECLSPREREVLREIAAGRRVGDVAAKLHISPHTVRNHLKSIFRKLDVHSQVALLGKLTRNAD